MLIGDDVDMCYIYATNIYINACMYSIQCTYLSRSLPYICGVHTSIYQVINWQQHLNYRVRTFGIAMMLVPLPKCMLACFSLITIYITSHQNSVHIWTPYVSQSISVLLRNMEHGAWDIQRQGWDGMGWDGSELPEHVYQLQCSSLVMYFCRYSGKGGEWIKELFLAIVN